MPLAASLKCLPEPNLNSRSSREGLSVKNKSVKKMLNNGLVAADGDIGRCKDLLLDELSWVIRYLVIDTHKWLPFGRKVVVSPISVDLGRSTEDEVSVSLTKDQIKHSPPLAEHEPVSREYEKALSQYYGYGQYWMGGGLWGAYPTPAALIEPDPESLQSEVEGENHLRSVQELEHYRIKCSGELIGHVVDFIFDEEDWAISNVVIETDNWPGGSGQRLLPVKDIADIEWAERAIRTTFSSSQVRELQSAEA